MMARPDIRHKRMRVGDLPPSMQRGDPDEIVDVYEDVSDPIFRRIPRLTDDEQLEQPAPPGSEQP